MTPLVVVEARVGPTAGLVELTAGRAVRELVAEPTCRVELTAELIAELRVAGRVLIRVCPLVADPRVLRVEPTVAEDRLSPVVEEVPG